MLDAALTWRAIRKARRTSYQSPSALRAWQEGALRVLLDHAYREVPLYRNLYDEAGFSPREFRGLEDLESVPTLTKARLKASGRDALVRGVDLGQCSEVATSGSTGAPLRVWLGPKERRWQRAVAWRILFENGFSWRDRTLEIRKTFGPTHPLQYFGFAPKDWCPITESPESWAEQLIRCQPQVVVAGASTLRALAEACGDQHTTFQSPRLVVSDSETLTPETRRAIGEGLRCDPVDVYGLVELSNFAWQCRERGAYHVSADSHVVEVVRRDSEGLGRVVATDLGMWTMPMIRYETGDLAEAGDGSCRCGRTLPTLRRVIGRAVDSVLLPSGRRLPWPFFHELLAEFTELQQWRVRQVDVRSIKLELVLASDQGALLNRIAEVLRADLPEPLRVDLVRCDKIAGSLEEKTRMVLSDC